MDGWGKWKVEVKGVNGIFIYIYEQGNRNSESRGKR